MNRKRFKKQVAGVFLYQANFDREKGRLDDAKCRAKDGNWWLNQSKEHCLNCLKDIKCDSYDELFEEFLFFCDAGGL